MKEIEKAQMGIITVLALMLVSIKRRLPEARKLSSGITTLALAGIVLLVAAGGASAADCSNAIGGAGSCNCGDTVVGDYTFTHDMTCPNTGDGLIIGANNIVIDGAGYKMTGAESNCLCYNEGLTDEQNPAPHCGIRNNGNYDNVVIKNLEIENFCTGIALGDVTHISVDNNTVTGCYIHHNGNDSECGAGGDVVTHGIHIVAANNCTITKNEITYNDGTGDQCGGGGNGIFMFGKTTARGNDNTITCNNLSYNAKSGFFMKKMCMYCIISYNKATNNGEGGIVPQCKQSRYNEIKYNNISNNVQVGYQSQGGWNDLMFNTIMNNGPVGIDIVSGSGCGMNTVITNNTVCGHTKDIQVGDPVNNTGDSNACGSSDIAGACDWNCDTKVSAYFDYDSDAHYSDDPANCSCTNPAGGKCACCNPGMFNSTHAGILNSTSPAIVWLTAGDDINDCDLSITSAVNWYCDGDGDSYISSAVSGSGAPGDMPAGCQLAQGNDCNDGNAAVNPGATEDCTNGIDDDCDGDIDCADSYCKPDLDITVKKEEWINDTHYNVNYTVCNIGICDAGESNTSIYIDTILRVEDPVATLTQSQCYTNIVGPFLWTSTSDNVTVCADNEGQVAEKDETNNCEMNVLSARNVDIYVDPQLTNIAPQDQFDINITIDPHDIPIYGVEYYLTYNPGSVRAESQVKGPFLGTSSDTIVVVNDIDRTNGKVSYAETRRESGGVTDKDISSVIQFTAIGPADNCTGLNLSGVIIVKADKTAVTYKIENGTVCITNNIAPVASGCSKHRINNVQKKFECLAQLCSNSYDPDGDDPDGGGKIVYIRWAFGDGEYGTSEGLGECPCKYYSYISWIWEPFGVSYDAGGRYVPFNVSLTVTDNGDPQLEDETKFNVTVYMAGDTNGDGVVNIIDAVYVGHSWGETCNTSATYCQPLWDDEQWDAADLNNDCKIDILDAVIVGTMWNYNAWYPV